MPRPSLGLSLAMAAFRVSREPMIAEDSQDDERSQSRSRSRERDRVDSSAEDELETRLRFVEKHRSRAQRDEARDETAGSSTKHGALPRLPDAHRNDLLAEWIRLIPLIADTIEDNVERREVMYIAFGKPPYFFLGSRHELVPAWSKGRGALQPIAQTRDTIRVAPHASGCFRVDYTERKGSRPGGYYTFMWVKDLDRDDVARAIVENDVLPQNPGLSSHHCTFCYTRFVRRKASADKREFVRTRVQLSQEEAVRVGGHSVQQGWHPSDIIGVGDKLLVESRIERADSPLLVFEIVAARAGSDQERYIVATSRATSASVAMQ